MNDAPVLHLNDARVGGDRDLFRTSARPPKGRQCQPKPPPQALTPAEAAYASVAGVPGYAGGANNYAAAFGFSATQPQQTQIVDARGSEANQQVNEQLQATIKQIVPQLREALKGTVTIKLPPGVSGDVSGGGGLQLESSGSF